MKLTKTFCDCVKGHADGNWGSFFAYARNYAGCQHLSRRRRETVAGVFTLLCAALVAFGPGSLEASDAVATGIIQPFIDVRLSPAVSGIVTARNVKEGDYVKAGDVLIELDNRLERLEVERRRVVRDQKCDVYEGTKKLFGTTKGVSKEELATNEAEFKVAAVEHDMAVEALRRRQVITPHSGEIAEIQIEIGEACQEHQPLIRVVDTSQCYFVTNLEPAQRSRFRTGQTVKLEVDTGDGRTDVQGTVIFLSPVVDPASGLTVMKVLIDNKDGRIRPGLTGVVQAQTQG